MVNQDDEIMRHVLSPEPIGKGATDLPGTRNTLSGRSDIALQFGRMDGDVHIHPGQQHAPPPTAVAERGAGTNLHVLIVEDEQAAADELGHCLQADARIGRIGTAYDAADALRYSSTALRRNQPVHAWFLDITMPGISGLDLAWAAECFAVPPKIVFVTCGDFALEAFERRAVDYVLKPVNQTRLTDTIDRLIA